MFIQGLGTECNLPIPHHQAPWTEGCAQQGRSLWPEGCHLGSPPALAREDMGRRRGHASSPMHHHPGAPALAPTSRAKLQDLSPPPNKAHYLRTTCSDTLMLRHRKASAAELSLNSLTGGELFKPCLGGLAILKLPGEEGRPKPQRAQLPGGESKPLEG